jgi:hypothetical protein
MAAASDQVNQPSPAAEEEEEIILLTDVVEDPPSEVVLEIAPGEQELDSLFMEELRSRESESPPEAPAAADEDEALDDFLASLKDLPEDLGSPAISPSFSEERASQEYPVPQATLEEVVRRELESFLSEAQLQEIVREVVQETVGKISQELVPQIAAQVMDRKIGALLKRLAEEE